MAQTTSPSAESTETTKSVAFIIEFEDHGQDFLRWHLAADGEVLVCEPFQQGVWGQKFVLNPSDLRVGDLVTIDLFGDPLTIRYPLTDVQAK